MDGKQVECLSSIIAVLILGIVIIVHEFGHFLLAKTNGIVVEEFSVGKGPRILSTHRGTTRYSLKLVPFGGSCMMRGEDGEDNGEGTFNSKSVWRRFSVIAAGPIFNFIQAFLFSFVILSWAGIDLPVLAGTSEGMPAQTAGLQEGDVITKIGGRSVHIWNDISLYNLTHSEEKEVEITYKRDGKTHTAVLEPRQKEGDTAPLLGVTGGKMERPGFFGTLKYGAYTVKYWIDYTVDSLRMLVTGRVGMKDLSGPVGIVSAVDGVYQEAAPAGVSVIILNLMNIGILITANLGVMNLLPLPALDGGRLVFLIIEAIRGKRVSPDKEGMVHFAGFALLMVLMVVVMFNDIMKLV